METPSYTQKYAMRIAYEGTRYHGWQRQPDKLGIQQVIEEALAQVSSEEGVSVVGSGRTDSGVHALAQVAHFTLKRRKWNPENIRMGLNSTLPPDIRVQEIRPVAKEFHAQRSAFKKQYSYYFQQGPSPLPHLAPYSWWIRKSLDVDRMNEAAQALRGEHDFKPFQGAGGKPGKSTVRQIYEIEVLKQAIAFPGGGPGLNLLVRIRVVGSGFLKQMVRGIAGTLLEVGEGKQDTEIFGRILETQDRSLLGATAVPRGLWLEWVDYGEWFD